MGSKQSTADYLLDQLSSAGDISIKKMFGEYGIYRGEKLVALICDDQLFVKPTSNGKAFIGPCEEASPYPGAKPCYLIAGDRWDDHEWMSHLVSITADQLPVPRTKTSKKRS